MKFAAQQLVNNYNTTFRIGQWVDWFEGEKSLTAKVIKPAKIEGNEAKVELEIFGEIRTVNPALVIRFNPPTL